MEKVLIIANIRKTQGGITTQVKELYDSLISEGIEAEVVSTHGRIAERIGGIRKAFFRVKYYDMILGVGCAYNGFFPIIIAYTLSVLKSKKVIYNFHDGQINGFLKKYSGFVNYIFRGQKVIVASKYLYDEFRRYGIESEIINNHFNDYDIPESKKDNSDNIGIMWARSFEKLYRVDLALDAAVSLLKTNKVTFHFYGGGSEFDYYKNKYLMPNIHFYGIKNRDELLKEYKKYQIFLNTSEHDNFPMSIVEAGLNSMIVVSSKVGGINTIYSNKELVYFESGNLSNLKVELGLVINNITEYDCYSQSLLNKVKSFNWTNVREKWLNILNINSK
jgi:hypothetical protein